MLRSLRIAIVLTAALGALVVLGVASAAPPETPPGRSEHERIVAYWTPERVARAIPRELTRDASGRIELKPGKGGGGGGAVTGAAWTGGGLVRATTGRVLFTMGGVNYVCSGTAVADARAGESLVVTAGHCAYDQVDFWATNWMFVPDYQANGTFTCSSTRYGCWTAQSLVTTTAWAAGDFNQDYAFAVMGPGGLNGTTLLESAVGTQAIAFTLAHPRSVYAFGYPAAAPYNGQSLIYCSGTDQADTWGGSTDFGLKCNMTGGSSGGPWFANFNTATGAGTITSVNSFRYVAGPQKSLMFGPYLGTYAQTTYTASQTATSNQLVAP